MARWIGPNPDQDIRAVLEAAAAWHERCILEDGSVFSDEDLWTLEHVQELERCLVGSAIEGTSQSFVEKLQQQLESAPVEIKHLAAEVCWFYYLFPKIRLATKRHNVKTIWEWSGSALPECKHMEDAALRGVIETPGFNRGIWDHFAFLLRIVRHWKEHLPLGITGAPEEVSWTFAKWLEGVDVEMGGMRHAFLYLLCPDLFEPFVSKRKKQRIVKAFSSRLPPRSQPVHKHSPLLEIDQALFEIRMQLQEEHETAELDFRLPPLKDVWDSPAPDSPEPPAQPIEPTPRVPEPTALNTILYGPPGTGKTYATTQRCVEICNGASSPSENIQKRYEDLVKARRVEFVTFHQSYGYEEFVEGLRPETRADTGTSDAGAGFRVIPTDGVLKRIARRARASDLNHVLVIDEINRANVSKVFGEIITLLEEDKRQGARNEVCVSLPHSGEPFTLPPNLFIVGTMNTADRSIALLDTALRRRFEFEELAPNPKLLDDAARATGIALQDVLQAINDRLEWLIDRDHLIGHAWLMDTESRKDLDRTMRRKIIPLVAEYFYDDWEKVRAVLGGTDDFVKRTRLAVPPGLDDSVAAEPRNRWEIRDNFPADAYTHLIGNAVLSPDAEST